MLCLLNVCYGNCTYDSHLPGVVGKSFSLSVLFLACAVTDSGVALMFTMLEVCCWLSKNHTRYLWMNLTCMIADVDVT